MNEVVAAEIQNVQQRKILTDMAIRQRLTNIYDGVWGFKVLIIGSLGVKCRYYCGYYSAQFNLRGACVSKYEKKTEKEVLQR
ncbi:1334_t:CDS:2 [Cetraspora pellucida]|uniref:1334_t:CDS:1 n=1 Tax=Cetraspora pellucida TaxID=1433469 RepID=A0A9N9GTW6_9GLOM|nr:1334_t:CDS:2 [Cetraspora pellucida]